MPLVVVEFLAGLTPLVIVVWALMGASIGALLGPRKGWQPWVATVIGAAFGLIGAALVFLFRSPDADEYFAAVAARRGRQNPR
jgi:hypothetical protein